MSSVHSEQKKDGEKKSRLGEGGEEGGCDENDGIIGGWAEGRESENENESTPEDGQTG